MKLQYYIFTLMLISLLSGGCGARYLAFPPPEFDTFVKSVPTPASSMQLAEVTDRYTAPRQICTTFSSIRLFGTKETYRMVVKAFEQTLKDGGIEYVKISENSKVATFFMNEFATVDISSASRDSPVTLMRFDQKVLDDNDKIFDTLFTFHVSHRYGDCALHPFWSK